MTAPHTPPESHAVLVNRLLTYTNQLDPLVPANNATLELWTIALRKTNMQAAKVVVVDYYGSIDPSDREPITPGYIRRAARRLEARHNDAVMCEQHDWNYRDTCSECWSEVRAGQRQPDAVGHNTKQAIAAPADVRAQIEAALRHSVRDVNAEG